MGRASTRNMLAGVAFVLFVVAGFIIRGLFPDLSSFYNYAFPCGGVIIGSLLGIAISLEAGEVDEGIKPVNAALLYPAVKEMQKRKGWKIDEHWQS